MSTIKDFNTFRGGSSDAPSSTEALLHNGMRLGSPHNEQDCKFESVMLQEQASEEIDPEPMQTLTEEEYAIILEGTEIKEERIPEDSSDEEPFNLEEIAGEKLIPQVAASFGRDPLKSEADDNWNPQDAVNLAAPQVQEADDNWNPQDAVNLAAPQVQEADDNWNPQDAVNLAAPQVQEADDNWNPQDAVNLAAPQVQEADDNWNPQDAVNLVAPQVQGYSVYTCEHCSTCFLNQETHQSHVCTNTYTVTNVQPSTSSLLFTRYQCVKCQNLFFTLDSFKRHQCNKVPDTADLSLNRAQSVTFLCSTCRVTYRSLENFKNHVCKSETLKCKNCSRLFINPFYLKNHIKVCQMQPNVKRLVVRRQGIGFQQTSQAPAIQRQGIRFQQPKSQAPAIQHPREKKKEKKYTCKICNIKLSCKTEAEKHMISAHCQSSDSDEEISCDRCHFTCSSQRHLQEHLKLHKTKFSCTRCDFICFSIADLSDHNKIHELACSEPKFSCDICDFICDSRDELVSHDATHINSPQDSTLMCNTCDFVADSMIELQQHKKLHLAESLFQYPCQFCGVSFINENELKGHVKENHSNDNQLGLHYSSTRDSDVDDTDSDNSDDSVEEYQPDSTESDDNSFACYLCDRDFSSISFLRLHESKVHSTTTRAKLHKPQFGKEDPDFSESIQKCLTERQRLHNDIFLCSHCNIEFISSNLLFYHAEKFHADIRMKLQNKRKLGRSGPNKCDECPSSFKSASYLRLHKLLHRGIKAFPCRYCGKQYAFNNAVLNHYKKVHPESGGVKNSKRKKVSIKCKYCDKQFINDHQRYCHFIRSHASQSSTQTSKVLPNLKLELLQKRDFKTLVRNSTKSSWFDYFECNHCLKKFPTDTKLFIHGQIDHKDIFVQFKARSRGSFPCEECGATCESKKQLRQHMMRHRGIKAYHCNYCPWKTTSISGLKTHVIRLHVQEYKQFQQDKAKKKMEQISLSRHEESSDDDSDDIESSESNDDKKSCAEKNETKNAGYRSESNLQTEPLSGQQNLQKRKHEEENEDVLKEKQRKLKASTLDFYSGGLELQNCVPVRDSNESAVRSGSPRPLMIDESIEEVLTNDKENSSGDERDVYVHNDKVSDLNNEETKSSEEEKDSERNSQTLTQALKGSQWLKFLQCNHCLVKLPSIEKVFAHGQLNHKDIFVKFKATSTGSFQCEECSASCDTMKQLQEHLMRHRGIKPYLCRYCTWRTTSANGLKRHVKRTHELEHYNFLETIEPGRTKPTISVEYSNVENVKQQTIGTLEKIQEKKQDSQQTEVQFQDYEIDHVQSVWYDYYECNHCLERFPSNTKLFIHGQLKHKDIFINFKSRATGPLKCDECPASCEDRAQLRDHVMHHRGIKAYYCNYCTKKGYTSSTIKIHVMTVHKEEYVKFQKSKEEKIKLKKLSEINTKDVQLKQNIIASLTNDTKKMALKEGAEVTPKYFKSSNDIDEYLCSHCNMKFQSHIMLFEHAQKHHSDVQCKVVTSSDAMGGDFQCNECSATFAKISFLRSHILLHRGVKAYVCRYCGQTYACRLALEMHYQADHPNGEMIDHTKLLVRTANEERGNFKCDVCKLGFKTIKILARHKLRHIENYRCKYCNQGFARSSSRWAHYIRHHQKQWEAEKNKSAVVEHGKGKKECTESEEKLDAEDIYMKYCSKTGRRGGDVFLCNYCSIGFKCSNQLFYHAQKMHGNIQVVLGGRLSTGGSKKCDECPSTFKTVSDLRLHKLLHRGITPYPCKYCGMGFNCRSSVLSHIKVEHKGGKNVIQNYTYSTSQVLRRKNYEEYGDLICDVCKVGYKNEKILKRHMLRHTKPFICNVCGIGFDNRNARWYHQRKMHSDKGAEDKKDKGSVAGQVTKQPKSIVSSSKWIDSFDCNLCSLEFATLGKLFEHAQEIHKDKCKRAKKENNGEHKCGECSSSFIDLCQLHEHILVHRGVVAYKCRHCPYRVSTLSGLKLHLRKQHSQKYIQLEKDSVVQTRVTQKKIVKEKSQSCKLCKLWFATQSLLKMHLASEHYDRKTISRYAWCKLCPRYFTSPILLKLHMMIRHTKTSVMCRVCDTPFTSQASLAYHMWKLHNLRKQTEMSPNKQYSKSQNVPVVKPIYIGNTPRRSSRLQQITVSNEKEAKNNKSSHTKQPDLIVTRKLSTKANCKPKQKTAAILMPIKKKTKKIKCKVCAGQYPSKVQLHSHMMSSHNIMLFDCDLCGKMFTKKISLLRHMKWHFPPTYKCSHCTKCYNKKYLFTTHICVNAEGRTFACKVCSSTFNTRELLLFHRRTKHIFVDTQCKCDTCGAYLKNKVCLKDHIRRFHLAHPYLCSICGATFSHNAYLKIHAKRHEELKWQCPHCPRKFLTSRDFYQHRNMIHLKRCHVCNICGRAIKAKQHYDFHMARHKNKVKPFPCSRCEKKYATLTALKYHLRVAHLIQ